MVGVKGQSDLLYEGDNKLLREMAISGHCIHQLLLLLKP